MAFNVRIFGYRGTVQLPLNLPKQFSSDSVQQLEQPYEFGQLLAVGAVAVRSAPNIDASKVQILRVEVPDGQSVRYEICPQLRVVDAGVGSPILSGINMFKFEPGWTISLIDAAALP